MVYGPASAVYGPNAEMGVINVITNDGEQRQANGETGASLTSKLTFGGPQRNLSSFGDSTKIADATSMYITKDFRLRLTARVENSVLDRSIGDNFEYTKPSYYADPRLWGASTLSTYANVAGRFLVPRPETRGGRAPLRRQHRQFAARVLPSCRTGLGTRYAADRFQTSTLWTSNEASVYGRHVANLNANVVSTTFVQYRESNVASPSQFLGSSYSGAGPNGSTTLTGVA